MEFNLEHGDKSGLVPCNSLELIIGSPAGQARTLLVCEVAPWPVQSPAAQAETQWLAATQMHLRELLRDGESIQQLDGCHVAVILRDAASDRAGRIGRSLLHRLGRSAQGTAGLPAAAWIGAAEDRQGALRPEDLIQRARRALQRARNEPQGGLDFYGVPATATAYELASIAIALRQSVVDGTLEIIYHARLDLVSGLIDALEARCRWQWCGQVVAGKTLAAVAERVGLGYEVAAWLFNESCSQASRWKSTADFSGTISIDVPASVQACAHFSAFVCATLQRHSLAPETLVLEFSEESLAQDPEASAVALRSLADCGVRLSVDGFGLLGCGLAQLRRLPASELKIDESLICGVEWDEGVCAEVRSIIAMAHAAHMDVVAEGVDSLATQAKLADMGCAAVQGPLIGAASADQVPALLLEHKQPWL